MSDLISWGKQLNFYIDVKSEYYQAIIEILNQ